MGAAMFLVACTQHRDIREAYEVEGDVEVEIAGRQTIDAVAVHGGFVAKYNGGPIAPQYITRIEDTRHGRGALQGLGLGALIGGTTGALIGYTSADEDDFLFNSKGEVALIGGVVMGMAGGFIGLVVGAIKGSTTVYEHRAMGTAVRVNGPSGSVAGVTVTF